MRNLLLIGTVAVAPVAMPRTAQATGACRIVTHSDGRVFAKKTADPGGDGAIYIYVDSVQTTYFSAKGRWFYVTSKKNPVLRGYDSENELECSG